MSNQPTNRILAPTSQPTQQDVVLSIQNQMMSAISCAKIGTIESYNPLLNTSEVSIKAQVELTDGRIFDYPLLVDCPTFKITGGSAYLSMPIETGDTCLVVFNDFDIDNWFYSDEAVLPATNRKHSLSDGMVFVGFNSALGSVPSLPGVAELYAGGNLLALGNSITSLKGLINNLIDVLKAMTVQVSATAYPLTAVSIAALEAEKAAFATLLSQGSSPV